MTGPGLARPLGFTEALCAEWFEVVPDGLEVVGALALAEPVAEPALARAVDAAWERHPALASCVRRNAGGDWEFAPGDRAAVTVGVAPPGSRWRDRFRAALHEPLDAGRALWRVELVEDPPDAPEPAVLLVAGCHVILDGVSLARLLRELVVPVAGAARERPRPPMEALLPPAAQPAAPGATADAGAWPVARRAAADDRRLGFVARTVDGAALRRLQARAHQEETTIAGVLLAACCRARAAVGVHTDAVGFNVPFDLRPRVEPPLPPETIGCYFGRAHVHAAGPVLDEDPWRLARELEHALAEDVRAATARPAAWDTASVQALMADVARADRSRFDLAFMLTDLGRCDLGPLATGFWFTTVQTAGVEALVVSAAGVADRLDLGIAWPRPLLPDGDAEAFADALGAVLRDMVA